MDVNTVKILIWLAFSYEFAASRPNPDMVASSNEDTSTINSKSAMDKITEINQANDLTYLYEGDINLLAESNYLNQQLSQESRDGQLMPEIVKVKRDAIRERKSLWKSRIVPYEISSDLENYEYSIKNAMNEIAEKSCIKFVQRSDEENWAQFVRRAGCWSSVGKLYYSKGPQEISLGNGCFQHSTIVHEILHSLGFWHEQSRPDRDKYVEIFWENIIPAEKYNFEKYSHSEADVLGVEYDLSSVMHYGPKAFSKNGRTTLKAIRPTNKEIGSAEGLSELDAIQLNALYDCKNAETNGWSQWSGYSPCDEKCLKYRQRFCSNGTNCNSSNEYGVETQAKECKKDSTECYAPINGNWGPWSSWSTCPASCGEGIQYRKRECTDPAPKYNGIYCQGNSTSSQICKMRSCSLGPDDCEFEYGKFCNWANDANNKETYTWSRNSGSTPSKDTGPDGDHTSNNGYYLYLEASSPAEEGDKAALVSKLFEDRDIKCLSFHCYMHGIAIGALRVYIEAESAKQKQLLWQMVGNQNQSWINAKITFQATENYKIIFEGERGSDFTGDIAIDDVIFEKGACSADSHARDIKPVTTLQPITQKDIQGFRKIGCYKDHGLVQKRRPFPKYLDYRFRIDWGNMQKTIEDCAQKAKELKYELFAIEFYGECWFGATDEVNYIRDGITTDCWNGVGKAYTMFVYKWE